MRYTSILLIVASVFLSTAVAAPRHAVDASSLQTVSDSTTDAFQGSFSESDEVVPVSSKKHSTMTDGYIPKPFPKPPKMPKPFPLKPTPYHPDHQPFPDFNPFPEPRPEPSPFPKPSPRKPLPNPQAAGKRIAKRVSKTVYSL